MKELKCSVSFSLILLLFLAVAGTPVVASAGSGQASENLASIETTMQQAVELARDGQRERAGSLVYEAFMAFESSELHSTLATSHSGLYNELESKYLQLRSTVKNGSLNEIESTWAEIQSLHDSVRSELGTNDTSFWTLFVSSFAIIFREGLEAILILAALGAYLVRINAGEQKNALYGGTIAAIVASVLLAVGAQYLFSFSGSSRELLEGVTMLLATGVLFYVSYWLISKAEINQWKQTIKNRIDDSVEAGSTVFLASTAFIVVFREGFETVLFYQALAFSTDTVLLGAGSIVGGFLAGVVSLAVAGYLIVSTSLRIPLRPFFVATSAFLYFLAFKFAGDGMVELQEAGYLPITPAPFVPDISWLKTFFGIYPSWPPLYLQSLLILALVGGLLYTFWDQLTDRIGGLSRTAFQ